MGVQREITFEPSKPLDFDKLAVTLRQQNEEYRLMMIDNLPAFPDETPADDWQDVRLSLTGGMLTLRKLSPGRIVCIRWGNEDPALSKSWESLARAVAEVTGGEMV